MSRSLSTELANPIPRATEVAAIAARYINEKAFPDKEVADAIAAAAAQGRFYTLLEYPSSSSPKMNQIAFESLAGRLRPLGYLVTKWSARYGDSVKVAWGNCR